MVTRGRPGRPSRLPEGLRRGLRGLSGPPGGVPGEAGGLLGLPQGLRGGLRIPSESLKLQNVWFSRNLKLVPGAPLRPPHRLRRTLKDSQGTPKRLPRPLQSPQGPSRGSLEGPQGVLGEALGFLGWPLGVPRGGPGGTTVAKTYIFPIFLMVCRGPRDPHEAPKSPTRLQDFSK